MWIKHFIIVKIVIIVPYIKQNIWFKINSDRDNNINIKFNTIFNMKY